MLRGAVYFEADNLRAVVDGNDDFHYVDFYENDHKIGRINYYGKSSSYAEDAAENFVYGMFSKDEVLKHVEQLEFEF